MLYYFGDGSDGALNVTSGTHNLPLNTVHQFTNVTINSGATLSTNSTTGSVLFLAVQDTFTLNGTINVSGKVDAGDNTWSFTVDGVTYSSPGVGIGSYYDTHNSNNKGFGSGGKGNGFTISGVGTASGGSGGNGWPGGGAGGSGGAVVRQSNGASSSNGGSGANSSGGGGGAIAYYSGTPNAAATFAANGGAGGTSYGQNGADGSSSYSTNPGYSGTGAAGGGGGGGSGGSAGRAGVHVIIRAKTIVLNGTVVTSGTDGGDGGNGGRNSANGSWTNVWGSAGLGGGGGSGGHIYLYYATALTNTATRTQTGGTGGSAGYGGTNFVQSTSKGDSGSAGTLIADQLTPSEYGSTITPDSAESLTEVGSPTVTPGAVTITPDGAEVPVDFGDITVTQNIWDAGSAEATFEVGGSITITQGPPPPPGEVDWSNLGTENTKEFIYKVSDHSGTFIGVWKDVSDDLQFSQPINSPGTTTTVRLSRSANQTIETREPLIDQAGNAYVDQDGDPYYVIGETSNTVGEDTDVQVGYRVDVIAVYGGYEELVDHMGETYVDQDGETYIVATGAPMGRRVFSGTIMKHKATYGETVGVDVILSSHGMGFSDEFVRSGATTTVTYSTTEIGAILKSVLDTNPGVMSYDNGSIDSTGTTITQKFQLNTKLEAIKSLYNQTPEGWYWYGNVADNLVYLKQTGSTPDHVFIKGKHISKIDPEQSIENLINVVHVIGGDVGGGVQLYKEYTDAASIAQWGRKVHRITDRRITLAATAQRYAQKVMSLYSQPIYTTTVEISSAAYDIETIRLGEMVGFSNFDNFIDGLVLQIVNFNYTPRKVTLQLGGLLDSQQRIVADLQEDLANEQYEQIPTAPS